MSSADQTPSASNELRADIRRLGDLLGETLVRQEGPELLELVERVRALTRERRRSRRRAARRHRTGDRGQAGPRLLHLLPPRQRDRTGPPRPRAARPPRRRGQHCSPAPPTCSRTATPSTSAQSVKNLNVRPVFTAHPTEAARRSVLNKLRRIAELLETPVIDVRPAPPRPAPGREHRPDLADRRAPRRTPRTGRRGPQRHLLPRRAARAAPSGTSWRTSPPNWSGSASSCPPAPARSPSAPGSAATATATPT